MIFLDYDQNSKKGFLKIHGEVAGECPDFPKEMTELFVEVDSWGGDFFLGLELYRNIKKLACRKTAKVETAMSAATMPVCACSSIVLQPDSLFMIHSVSAVGVDCNAAEAFRLAGELTAMNKQLAGIYSASCKKTEDEILSLIEKETYLTPREMRDLGFPVIVENIKNKRVQKKKSYDMTLYVNACQSFFNILSRRLNMDEKNEEKKVEEQEECKTEEAVPEVEEVPEVPALTEDRVREICVEVFNQLFENLKAESEEKKPEEELPEEEKKEEEESVENKVANAIKAERARIAALNSYSGLTDSSFLATAIESGLSEADFAVEVLRQQKLQNEHRRQQIASTAPLAPVQAYSEPSKVEPKADPKKIMNMIFG